MLVINSKSKKLSFLFEFDGLDQSQASPFLYKQIVLGYPDAKHDNPSLRHDPTLNSDQEANRSVLPESIEAKTTMELPREIFEAFELVFQPPHRR